VRPTPDLEWCADDDCVEGAGVGAITGTWEQALDRLQFAFASPLPVAPSGIVFHGPDGVIPPSTPVMIEGVGLDAGNPGVTSTPNVFRVDGFLAFYVGSPAAIITITSVDFVDADYNVIATWNGPLTVRGDEDDTNVDPGSCYTDPITDGACWYDPNYPESADFLGVLVNDLDGLDQDGYVRSSVAGIADGYALGRGNLPGKVLTFTVTLFATSCAGMEWGRRWLQRTLRGESCDHGASGTPRCGTNELRIRACCPTELGADDGIRVFPRAALTDGVKRSDGTRRDGCADVYQTYTFVMTTTTSAAFGELVEACVDVEPNSGDVECADWDTWCDPPAPPVPCTCSTTCDGTCPEALFTSPSLLAADLPCGPFERVTSCCCINGSASSSIGSAIVFELFAGEDPSNPGFQTSGATDVRVEFYANPKQLPCPSTQEERAAFVAASPKCADVNVCRIPAGARLRVDGRTGRVTLICEGVERTVYDLVGGDVSKVVAGCTDIVACVSWNAWAYVPGPATPTRKPSSFTVWTAPRYE
jgi:hypothetical protein